MMLSEVIIMTLVAWIVAVYYAVLMSYYAPAFMASCHAFVVGREMAYRDYGDFGAKTRDLPGRDQGPNLS